MTNKFYTSQEVDRLITNHSTRMDELEERIEEIEENGTFEPANITGLSANIDDLTDLIG